MDGALAVVEVAFAFDYLVSAMNWFHLSVKAQCVCFKNKCAHACFHLTDTLSIENSRIPFLTKYSLFCRLR